MFYKKIIKPILFSFPPEFVHDALFIFLYPFQKISFLNNFLFKINNFTSPRIKQRLFGLYFRTPIGLAAGMDKNALGSKVWSAFDFGWSQIGSVTYSQQAGNPKPRLWRLPEDNSLVIHYGLANDGAKKIAKRIQKINRPPRGLWSVSIAKSNHIPLEKAADDIALAFGMLHSKANIITINLSCPNVKDPGGLQKKELLEPILKKLVNINMDNKPIWLKIGLELNIEELANIIHLAKQYNVSAIIATNLSKDRSKLSLKSKHKDKPGSVSGKPIEDMSNNIISHLYQHSEGKYKVIGVGGIFSGQDAYKKIKAGANLLQIATGFIYGGPMTIKRINKELDELLKKDGYNHISQAVGVEANKYNL